jgi:hypothetical protein
MVLTVILLWRYEKVHWTVISSESHHKIILLHGDFGQFDHAKYCVCFAENSFEDRHFC